jgi:hypothetical protein
MDDPVDAGRTHGLNQHPAEVATQVGTAQGGWADAISLR